MRTSLGYNSPETRNESQIEVEDVHQPLDGCGRLVGQNLDQVRPRLVSRRLQCVIVELLDAVANLVVNLCPCRAPLIPDVALVELPPMKSGPSQKTAFGRWSSFKLTVLVEQNNITTSKVNGVSSAQAGHWVRG